MSITSSPVGVLGAGSWGTALALLLGRNGQTTWLWDHEPAQIEAMRAQRQNVRYLPGFHFPETVIPTHDLDLVLEKVSDLLLVIPSHAFLAVLEQVCAGLRPDTRVAWATKGLEPGRACPLHEVVEETLGRDRPAAVISGPTFAREVAAALPTAVTVASRDPEFATDMARRLHNAYFRVYTSDDVVGIEVGGTIKNVLAIAAGVADGLGFGANTRAALITRGLAEMTRFGVAAGGRSKTFMGLAGLGDLILTCTDDQSRNRRMGLALAQGKSVNQALTEIGQVVEGVAAAREVARMAARIQVEMPICDQVNRLLNDGITPSQAVRALLEREDAHAEA